jgi:outer membrane protein assembly factor BamB
MGPYRLLGRLGDGGMGRVFLGMSVGGRPVAVKVIRTDLVADPEFRTRFRREVAAARQVSGLFTVMVVDADTDGPIPWLATAYVAGPSLAEAVNDHGPLPAASVLTLAAGLAESLAAIHAVGVVHRDLKPSNVLLAEDGPRVIDFGISRAAEATSLTSAGIVVGSPGFMSPEQAGGDDVGPASDIFSLGAVLAFAATGEGPFGTGPSEALLYRVIHNPANLDRLPDEVRPLVERCLAKEPGRRPTAAGILAEVGPVQAVPGWLPQAVIRASASNPVPAAGPAETGQIPDEEHQTQAPASLGGQTLAPAARGEAPPPSSPVVMENPRGDRDRPGAVRRRGLRRPLALVGVIGVLIVAAAVAGFALTGTAPRAHVSGSSSSPSPRRSRTPGSPKQAARGWIFATAASVDGAPTVADGLVYVGDDNGNIYAIDAATGALRWKRPTGSSVVSRPAVIGGTVYIGSENNDVYALNAATGAVRWKYNTGQSVDSGPAVTGGAVYVGNDNNEVFALSAATDAVRWTQPNFGDNVTTNPVVSDGTVYVGCEDNSVYALNAATGAIRWHQPTGGQVNSSPALSGGTVYVGSDDGKVYALNAATGAVEWTRHTAGKVDSGPAVSGETVYVGGGDTVYALDAATGAVEWTRHTGGAVASSPAVSGGTVYVGSDDGYVYALDAATGAIRWREQTGGDVDSSPAVSGGIVYIGTDNDAVYAFNAANGRS